MKNDIILQEKPIPVQSEVLSIKPNKSMKSPVPDEVLSGKNVDEVIAVVKADRLNTSRAITADIASIKRTQSQYEQEMATYRRELRRKDISDDYRENILDRMSRAEELYFSEIASSREFQEKQLNHLHKQPWKILGCVALIVLGGIGGSALLRAAA